MTHNFSIRLPEDVAEEAQTMARVEGVSVNSLVRDSLVEAIERRRSDPEFMARLKKALQRDKELLERLAK